MGRLWLGFTVIALAWALAGCTRSGPRAAVDPELAACLPAGTVAVAGVDLEAFRESGLLASLGPSQKAIVEPVQGATYLLAAYTGTEALFAVRGSFLSAPAGWERLRKRLAVTGPGDLVSEARDQVRFKTQGAEWLMERAEPAARGSVVWGLVQGGVRLPLSGNAANLNKLASYTESASFSLRLRPEPELEIAGVGRTEQDAAKFEGALRAFITIAAMTSHRDPAFVSMLHAAEVRRDKLAVRTTLRAPAGQAGRLLGLVAH